MIEVLGQGVESETFRNPIHPPRLCSRLEPADEQLACIFLDVRAGVGIAKHRKMARQAGDGLRHHIEVLSGMQGYGSANGGSELVAPHAGTIDDELRFDIALRCADTCRPPIFDEDFRNLDVFENLRAAAACTLGQRLRRVDRVGLAVLGQMDRTEQVICAHQRPEFLGLAGGEDVGFEPEAAGHRGAALQLLETSLAGRQRQRSNLEEARGLTGFLFERGIELRGVLGEAGQIVCRPELADETCGMPGGARGELLALEYDDVLPAAQRQMIGEATPDNPATDDDNLGTFWNADHLGPPRNIRHIEAGQFMRRANRSKRFCTVRQGGERQGAEVMPLPLAPGPSFSSRTPGCP